MKLIHIALVVPLVGWALLSGCSSGSAEAAPAGAAEAKDSEVRAYIQDSLVPYLTGVAKELCQVKYATVPDAPGKDICPSIGYTPPPTNGKP